MSNSSICLNMLRFDCIVTLTLFLRCFAASSKSPNIVLILTDDQDLLMGSLTPMNKTLELIANKGATFTNAYVSTPICCPSRASILSGKYQHNHKTLNNSVEGGCNSPDWQSLIEPKTFASYLNKFGGYQTFYAGKYLNQYGTSETGGTGHVPPGWDWWFGLVGNSRYYNYSLSVNGSKQDFTNQYLTKVIESYAVNFLDSTKNSNSSFLMVLAPPAPHAPFTPEPKYKGFYSGIKVPRTPNYNIPVSKDRHWLMQMLPSPLPLDVTDRLDEIHASRWEALLSVDDLVSTVVTKLEASGDLDNTFIIFTSDHGFHLGQFSLAWDKRQLYETDIKIPLLMRGPGIQMKQLIQSPVVNIDIAPTLLEIAGITIPEDMDGHSMLQLTSRNSKKFRLRDFIIEYHGEGDSKSISEKCPWKEDNNLSECTVESACKCQDARNNTYNCLRRIDLPENNFVFCDFQFENTREVYDLINDPYQLNNCANRLTMFSKLQLKDGLDKLRTCKGPTCRFTNISASLLYT